jgi:hypothetical protein
MREWIKYCSEAGKLLAMLDEAKAQKYVDDGIAHPVRSGNGRIVRLYRRDLLVGSHSHYRECGLAAVPKALPKVTKEGQYQRASGLTGGSKTIFFEEQRFTQSQTEKANDTRKA